MLTLSIIWLAGFIVWLCLCLYTFAVTPELEQRELRSWRAILVAVFLSALWPISLILAIIDYARDGDDE